MGESPVRSEGFDGFLRVMQDTYNPAMLWKSILVSCGDDSKKGLLRGRGSLRQAQGAPSRILRGGGSLRRESNRGPWHPGKRARPEYRAGCGPPRTIGDILARGSNTGGSWEARRPRSKVGRREPPPREISILREGGSLRPTFEPASHGPQAVADDRLGSTRSLIFGSHDFSWVVDESH